MPKDIIDVRTSEMKVASNDKILRSTGIGSCIAITMYDRGKKIGALGHAMLTRLGTRIEDPITNLRYIEDSIDAMIKALKALEVPKERLEAKIFGGAHMFKVFETGAEGLGARNIEAAQKKLQQESITVVSNDTGGNVGRSVLFDLKTGIVEVKTKV